MEMILSHAMSHGLLGGCPYYDVIPIKWVGQRNPLRIINQQWCVQQLDSQFIDFMNEIPNEQIRQRRILNH